MNSDQQIRHRARRAFLTSSACGLGAAAVESLLQGETPHSAGTARFRARAKACIFVFMAGGPSQLDLFDSKPKLKALQGQTLSSEMVGDTRFAFIKPASATLMASPRKFYRHGESGMELSELLPHLGSCADDLLLVRSMQGEQFNHHPAQLAMQCGVARAGMPTAGAWVTYALGSESANLPGYVVLTAGRGTSGGATLYQSGFLPTPYSGVLFRNVGEPVLNLDNPAGVARGQQTRELAALTDLNRRAYERVGDPRIAARIKSYELAGRMQLAAPELTDLSGESEQTLNAYGVLRKEPDPNGMRGTFPHLKTYQAFARNCLLARRMVERGVRFVNILHASWDQHRNLDGNLAYNAGVVDQPLAALINDLKQRGMLDETMVVWGSEFGRTPMGENLSSNPSAAGRDHHPSCFSMLLAGGGMRGGLTYGKTNDVGFRVEKDPVSVNDLHATLLHQFGIDHLRLTYRFQGRDFRLTDVAGRVLGDWVA